MFLWTSTLKFNVDSSCVDHATLLSPSAQFIPNQLSRLCWSSSCFTHVVTPHLAVGCSSVCLPLSLRSVNTVWLLYLQYSVVMRMHQRVYSDKLCSQRMCHPQPVGTVWVKASFTLIAAGKTDTSFLWCLHFSVLTSLPLFESSKLIHMSRWNFNTNWGVGGVVKFGTVWWFIASCATTKWPTKSTNPAFNLQHSSVVPFWHPVTPS